MKKLLHLAAALVLMAVILTGCAVEIKRTPIDCRYTEAYDSIDTEYEYQYDYLNGEYRYLPKVKNVHRPARYEILYIVYYDDGTCRNRWIEVSRHDYELFRQEQSTASK